jgi:PHD/YefM family antitoxin component YafN of YafNO toxin-antitoxin module
MRTVNLEEEGLDLAAAIDLARKEPVLLVAPDGQEFLLAGADDFDEEVETLRGSLAFQRFLDERSRSPRRIPLEEIEAEIDREA